MAGCHHARSQWCTVKDRGREASGVRRRGHEAAPTAGRGQGPATSRATEAARAHPACTQPRERERRRGPTERTGAQRRASERTNRALRPGTSPAGGRGCYAAGCRRAADGTRGGADPCPATGGRRPRRPTGGRATRERGQRERGRRPSERGRRPPTARRRRKRGDSGSGGRDAPFFEVLGSIGPQRGGPGTRRGRGDERNLPDATSDSVRAEHGCEASERPMDGPQ